MDIMPEVISLSGVSLMLITYAYEEDISTHQMAYLQIIWASAIISVTIISDGISMKRYFKIGTRVHNVDPISEVSLPNLAQRSITPKYAPKR